MNSKAEDVFISFVTDVTFLVSSTDWNSEVSSLFNQLLSALTSKDKDWKKISDLSEDIHSLNPKMEFLSVTDQIVSLMSFNRLCSEQKLVVSLITQLIFQVSSMDMDSESELISLINQMISLFNSKPDSEMELVSLITKTMLLGISVDSDSEPTQESEVLSLISQLISLKPEPELASLIRRIICRFISMNWEPVQFISCCLQGVVKINQGKFCVTTDYFQPREKKMEECNYDYIMFWRSATIVHFHCLYCNGENHEEYDKVPVEVKHPFHPKHSLQLALLVVEIDYGRECYCCNEKMLGGRIYYCSDCDYAMTFDCVMKPPPVLCINHPKWHEHNLALFPSQDSLTCSLCAIPHSSCPFYICPPCDFIVHQKCLSLPRVIRISRHPHRISFTFSFDKGDRCCRVCQRKINKDYGGYSCIKKGCSYSAHSRCATQTNVWDGVELEGVPEEIEEVLDPFVRISDGIIQHFSHPQHYLKLDDNTGRDYDENKLCQACITPVYFGNFYSCMECEIILHEKCANFPRKLYIPIHPHLLTLVGGYDGVMEFNYGYCSVCKLRCTCGLFYECGVEECRQCHFKMHVQCATISEPLVHESHVHPLFLTSKPEEGRDCSVCTNYMETFNCIEDECDFSLCFECATTPQKVRYKHDKHMLTLSYGEETSTMTYWCEVCEEEVNPKERFYKCDEYCCVTTHIECLIGEDSHIRPGSLLCSFTRKVDVLPNNQHMSRPFCSRCNKRCSQKIVFQDSRLIFCSVNCAWAN